MNKLYNTQKNLARDLAKFFKKVSNVTKPQLKIIPYIILGMIEAIREVIKNYKINKKEIHITMDHMYCRDDFTVLVFSMRLGKQRNTIMVQKFQRKKSIRSM